MATPLERTYEEQILPAFQFLLSDHGFSVEMPTDRDTPAGVEQIIAFRKGPIRIMVFVIPEAIMGVQLWDATCEPETQESLVKVIRGRGGSLQPTGKRAAGLPLMEYCASGLRQVCPDLLNGERRRKSKGSEQNQDQIKGGWSR